MKEFELPLEEWATLNHERYSENQNDSRVIGFVYDDIYITNPFLDESGLKPVDPLETYGELYLRFVSEYEEKALQEKGVSGKENSITIECDAGMVI